MSVLLEFTIRSDQFKLGHVLSGSGDMRFELERIVPTGGHTMPFVWVSTERDPNEDLPRFEANMRESDSVQELLALDRVDDGGLYRIEWEGQPEGLIKGLAEAEATVLEAFGDRNWTFRVRFMDHERLTNFHNYLTDHDISVHIIRTYTFTEEGARRRDFGLTNEQREALVLALQRGYFDTPSEVTLDELAEELGITKQAISDRIRRGNEKMLRPLLLSSAAR
ncbi:helix-turn-helix domain-containing protein [Haloprofundus salinisoli]|uniref:helix-turn-helix domain-containing protein n=1 Tax=Haloprofundus salinisoli TaxID=2876193 RepID=UPI001CCE528B|nr:helix-turn-helix domain-containing protein [Haloprofundus salinisoli]